MNKTMEIECSGSCDNCIHYNNCKCPQNEDWFESRITKEDFEICEEGSSCTKCFYNGMCTPQNTYKPIQIYNPYKETELKFVGCEAGECKDCIYKTNKFCVSKNKSFKPTIGKIYSELTTSSLIEAFKEVYKNQENNGYIVIERLKSKFPNKNFI